MKLKQHSSIGLAFAITAGLLFAGCAGKTKIEGTTPVSIEKGGTTFHGTTHGVVNGSEPSSHTVYFAFDSSELDAAARGILDANAAWLKVHHDTSITIEGNCDERGSREYNLALGQQRANHVRSYLVDQGAPSSSIDTVSFGEERPACQGTGEACWAQNRHADLVVR